jgi:hypothetical protein
MRFWDLRGKLHESVINIYGGDKTQAWCWWEHPSECERRESRCRNLVQMEYSYVNSIILELRISVLSRNRCVMGGAFHFRLNLGHANSSYSTEQWHSCWFGPSRRQSCPKRLQWLLAKFFGDFNHSAHFAIPHAHSPIGSPFGVVMSRNYYD